MKKILAVLLAMGIAVVAFAESSRTRMFAIDFCVPMSYQCPDKDNISSSMVFVGGGLQIFDIFNEKFGYFIDVELGFPKSYTLSNSSVKTEVDLSAYDKFFGISVFAAPSFVVMKNDSIKMFVSPGIHFFGLIANMGKYNINKLIWGIGANYTCAYYFNPNCYVLGGADLFFDFYYSEKTSYDKKNSGFMAQFGFLPKIGVGFQY